MKFKVIKGHPTYGELDTAIEADKDKNLDYPVTHVLDDTIYGYVGSKLPPRDSGIYNSLVLVIVDEKTYTETLYSTISSFIRENVLDNIGGNLIIHASPHQSYLKEIKNVFAAYKVKESKLMGVPFNFIHSNAVFFENIDNSLVESFYKQENV